jgi:hypothetical protein
VLKTLDLSDFIDVSGIFPQPYAAMMSTSTVAPFDLPSVLVPPEVIELEVLSPESSEDAPIKKEEWPEYMLRLFDNDVRNFPVFSRGRLIYLHGCRLQLIQRRPQAMRPAQTCSVPSKSSKLIARNVPDFLSSILNGL